MTILETTTLLVAAADVSYTDPISGTFTATELEVASTAAMFYLLDGSTIYSGKVRITEGLFDEQARIIEVVDATHVIVEQLVNTVSYTTLAEITSYGYDGTPGTPELAKNSISLYMYPSLDRADQGVNKTRDDVKALNTEIEVSTLYLKNLSQGLILKSSSVLSQIRIVGTSTCPILFGRDDNFFIEDAVKTLDVSSVGDNQFVDIYIQEETGDTPVVDGTLPILLVGKASGITPFTTSAVTNQYLVGCVYIQNSYIIGLYSLETPNVSTSNEFVYHNTPFNFAIGSAVTTYITQDSRTFYIPTFVTSIASLSINGQIESGVEAADEVNIDIGLSINDAASVTYSRYRESPLAVNTKIWRRNFCIRGYLSLAPGLNYIKLAGRANADLVGTGKSFLINTLEASIEVKDSNYVNDSEA